MSHYCCFMCPREDKKEHQLSDKCSICGRPYDFPLQTPPINIRNFKIEKPLDRGFFGAIYKVKYGSLNVEFALKVIPISLYKYFKHDFKKECEIHSKVSEGTDHVVKIYDMFDEDILFGDVSIPCHVAQIEFVKDAKWLNSYLNKNTNVPARTIAQISLDLLSILAEFENKGVHHNDLHDKNILVQELKDSKRGDAIDERIRAIAVDISAVAEASKSDKVKDRLGDIHCIAAHMKNMVDRLLANPAGVEEIDYRLASLLEERVHLLQPAATSQKTADNWTEQWKEDIRRACQSTQEPWQEPLKLTHFNDFYNAQTIEPWFVPNLLVDPQGLWVNAISTPGPQIITGMRGCGKTMLLRAVQFHARASTRREEQKNDAIKRFKSDNYVGLYVSCTKLLDLLGKSSEKIHKPYARLFIAYTMEAIRAIRHLEFIDKTLVNRGYYYEIAQTMLNFISNSEELETVGSSYELEKKLLKILISLSRGEDKYDINSHPTVVFPYLAATIRKCTTIWNTSTILFLLDDVSTRYLNESSIFDLMSQLLFQNPECAFKITTETQTLRLGLLSPGNTAYAYSGRDYDVFDLGAEVNKKMREHGKDTGRDFVCDILKQRALYYQNHPNNISPKDILGEVPLETIALKIASTTANSGLKKSVYHGINALAGVCVGDIGDIISMYEMILRNAAGRNFPISPSIQSDCFQRFCSRKLYDLNRRESYLKDFALSFAEASHKLLVDSCKSTIGKSRLRQYLSIYVRVTKGDQKQQFQKLRELIDAGIFVLEGGSDSPRTKTRDSNPLQQFKLTYRKLFGLSNYIGLSERDRFELSGGSLEEWLTKPNLGKNILLRNLEKKSDFSGDEQTEVPVISEIKETEKEDTQTSLFKDRNEKIGSLAMENNEKLSNEIESFISSKVPKISQIKNNDLNNYKIDKLVIGLGFETRCTESVRRTIKIIKPKNVIMIKYQEPGYSEKIGGIIKRAGIKHKIVRYTESFKYDEISSNDNVLVDITGLAKPMIFNTINDALIKTGRVFICYTRAKKYYPLEVDVKNVLFAERKHDPHELLKKMNKIFTGEKGPYEVIELLKSEVDETRRRMLCAFVSPKHERLLTLLDKRGYEKIELLVSSSKSARSKMAKIIADIAVRNYPPATVTETSTNDLHQIMKLLVERYQYWFVERGYNYEIAIIGSKLQAVASAVLCSKFKISHCWYLKPKEFDTKRFTKGVEETCYYEISIK